MGDGDDKNFGGGFGLFRGTSAITTPQHTEHYFHIIEASHNLTGFNFSNEITLSWMDESPGTGTNTYSLGYLASGVSGYMDYVRVVSSSTFSPFRMTLFEIQR